MDTKRKETVNRSIQQVENHPNRDLLLQDFNKSEEINPFSEESKDLITDMGNCALHWEVGIVYCTSGKYLQPTERNRQMNKERCATCCQFLVMSLKENPSHGARHGPSMRQTMYFKAHDMLRKARSNKNGNCKTLLERWKRDEQYRKSLSDTGWTEEQIKQYDALALEDHFYVATPEERGRKKNSRKYFYLN